MNASVHPFPGDSSKTREHFTVPVDEFSEKLGILFADCEAKGAREALLSAEADAGAHFKVLAMLEETRETRARFWEAQLKLIIRGMGV